MTLPPRLLIAGCGYLGFRVAKQFLTDGWHVSAITRSADRAEHFRQAGIAPVVTDLSDLPSRPPASLADCDAALWCVGYDRSAGADRRAVWVDGLRAFLQCLNGAAPPAAVCVTSSVSVYGDRQGDAVDESTPPAPSTDSGGTCVDMEHTAVTTMAEHLPGVRLCRLRLAGLYGPDRLLRRIADLRAGTPLAGTGDEWLNLVHIDDAVRCTQSALCDVAFPELANIVADPPVTRLAYYSTLARLCEAPPPQFVERLTDGDAQDASRGSQSSRRARSGNKRVTSRYRERLQSLFEFDDLALGLQHAVDHSVLPPPTG